MSNRAPQRNNQILYVLLSIMVCVLSLVTIIAVIKWIGEGLYIPESAPISVKFAQTPDAKLIGFPKLDTLDKVSETTCLERCDKDNVCMSVSYSPEERSCLLYAINETVDPTLIKTDSKGWNYYEKRYFWSRFGPEMSGSFDDYGALDVIENDIATKKDCGIKCINKSDNPKCMGFNYNGSDQRCKLVGIGYKGNEGNLDKTDTAYVYHELLFKETPVKSIEKTDTATDTAGETTEKFVNYERNKRFWGIVVILLIGLLIFKRR